MNTTFYHPVHFEKWNPEFPDQRGIGGSETSQIELAWRLAARGHDVVSYAPVTPDWAGRTHRGVLWLPLEQVDWSRPGLWLLYRCPDALDHFPDYHPSHQLWVLSQDEHYDTWNESRLGKLDRLICLCQTHAASHARSYPGLGSKICVASNGIRMDLIREVERAAQEREDGPPPRNPHRLMYASSPDRGLRALLAIFKRAREWVPDLELVIAYGYDNINKLEQINPAAWKYQVRERDRILKLADQPGVRWTGRIGQRELYREWLGTGIWVYPTTFTETSCVTCQPSGSKVFTKRGMMAIEDVAEGDFVLTHKGRFRRVTKTICRSYTGWMYSIRRRKDHRPIQVTEGHPVAAVHYNKEADYGSRAINSRVESFEDCWCGPEKLHPHSYLITPKVLTESTTYKTVPWSAGCETIRDEATGQVGGKRSLVVPRTLDARLGFFLGLYCAEGWVQHQKGYSGRTKLNMIGTAHHIRERHLADGVAELLGGSVRVIGNTLQTESYNQPLAAFLDVCIGHGARKKQVPEEIWDSPLNVQRSFLAGLLSGDGSVHKTRNRTSYSTASESLAYGVAFLLTICGVFAGIQYNKKRKAFDLTWPTVGKLYTQHREHRNFFTSRTRSITKTPYDGPVYNLEVEDDRSYVTDRTAVHNCMEAQSLGAIPITNPLWALGENVMHGVFIQGDPYTDGLTQARYAAEIVRLASDPDLQEKIRKPMMRDARVRFNWENEADRIEAWAYGFDLKGVPKGEKRNWGAQYCFQLKHAQGRILNIGCEQDLAGFRFLDCVNLDVTPSHPTLGYDYEANVLADAREPLPFDEASFDSVVAGEILEHMERSDALRVLQNSVRVVKPGGRVIITCPDDHRDREAQNAYGVGDTEWYVPPSNGTAGVLGYHRPFPKDELVGLVEQAGLKVKVVQQMDYTWFLGYGIVAEKS